MTAANILNRLQQLGLPPGAYVVHSSASLVLRGILPEAGDLDLVAGAAAWNWALGLVADGRAQLEQGRQDARVKVGADVEVYDGWMGERAADLIARAELVAGVPCAPLADVIAMKQRLDRPKDREHLKQIRAHLNAVVD